jgi:hypothetical protein
MGRCCNGRNAYKPISKTRYYAGLTLFILFHLNFKITLWLRNYLIKNYPYYKTLKSFHQAYFLQTLKEIKDRQGMCVENKRTLNEE